MQRLLTCRSLGLFSLVAVLTACHPSMNSASGQTPAPSNTTQADANSTAAPDNALSTTPGVKYFAKVAPSTHGVIFSVWANGRPVISVFTPGQSVDITPEMRGHANKIAVQWERHSRNGHGTLTVGTAKKPEITVNVSAHSPGKGQITKTFIAAQAPVSR